MPNPRRLQMEMKDLSKGVDNVEEISFDEANLSQMTATIVPTEPPFNKGKFKVQLTYPAEFPFKPPTLKFLTPIYHPNVSEKGTEICLDIINSEHWKPATRTRQILEAIVKIISVPEPDHPLRADLAEQFVKDRPAFDKAFTEFIKKHNARR